MNNNHPNDLIIILGPTASGKTKLAVQIAHDIKSEIISADSRQVYKGMDIGTGKDLDDYILNNKKIPYHLIDIRRPQDEYNVLQFQKDAQKIILKLKHKSKIPILCGGTGLYLKAILMNYKIPSIKPDLKLRIRLEQLELNDLIYRLNSLCDNYLQKYSVDTKRRVIRAIEIEKNAQINKAIKKHQIQTNFNNPIVIGIELPRQIIRKKITTRLHERLKEGMIEEVITLIDNGVTHEKLERFGLEYRYISYYLQEKMDKDEMVEKLNIAIHQFSKRQMTFFRNIEKNGIKINWINNFDYKNIFKLIKFP